MSIDVSVHNVFNPTTFYNISNDQSEVAALLREYENIRDAKVKEKITNLWHTSDDGENTRDVLISVAARNAFDYEEYRDHQSWNVLRIYERFSRINHSCRPTLLWTGTLP